ncbi:ImmA/IrrE family metallo-endopeptidase [Lacimonas salitolerans]|uniref:ImmA/IrrE family metallo-endopeptidase n=1 Tax=Lacimonas salitolerans TaxID=1323750 RepID=UPI0036D3C9D5
MFKRLPEDGHQRNTLRNFNLGMMRPGKIQSVKELAESLGLDVRELEGLPRRMAGRLVSDPFAEAGYAIEVNKNHSIVSKRFAVLHELGHFLLHVDRSDPIFDPLHLNRGDDEFYYEPKQEAEANAVADVLLFGDGALEAAISLHGRKSSELAKYFGVSEQMVEIALRKFSL